MSQIQSSFFDWYSLFRRPKQSPFKQWLAQLARERLEEIDDPEQVFDRLMVMYYEYIS